MPNDNAGAVELPSLKGLESLSGDDFVESLFQVQTPEDKIVEDQKALDAQIAKDAAEKEIVVSAPVVEPVVPLVEKDKKDAVVPPVEKAEDDELEVPGEVKKPDIKDPLLNDVDGEWLPIAKELDLTIKADTFEDFKIAFKEKMDAIKNESVTAKKEDIISSFKPESQLMILGLENGLTMEQINKPFASIDNFLAMNDVDLVAEDLKLSGMPEALVEKEITRLSDANLMDVEAFKIRKFLTDEKETMKTQSIKDLNDLSAKNEQRKIDLIAKDTTEIHSSLKSITKVLESNIGEKHIDFVLNKYKKGEYQELLKDSNFVAKAILHHEFGEKAASLLAKKKFDEGRNGIVNKLHNIPPIVNGPGGQTVVTQSSSEVIGNFAFLEGLNAEDL